MTGACLAYQLFPGRDRRVEQQIINIQLVGGFNPFEKYESKSQNGNLPQIGLKIPKIFESTSQSVYIVTAVQGKNQNTTPQSSTFQTDKKVIQWQNISNTKCAFEIHLPHLSLWETQKKMVGNCWTSQKVKSEKTWKLQNNHGFLRHGFRNKKAAPLFSSTIC